MKLLKIIQVLIVIMILALIYINMQIKIFELAYQGKEKENQIIRLREKNGMLNFRILQLKSSNHLGWKLLDENSKLQFRDNTNVLELVAEEAQGKENMMVSSYPQRKNNVFFGFFSLKSQAEANADIKRKK